MAHCCSQCSFTAQFESALAMHHQLHHENGNTGDLPKKSFTIPQATTSKMSYPNKERSLKLSSHTSSATKLFEKFRAKICRSKLLVTQQEKKEELPTHHDLTAITETASKAFPKDMVLSKDGMTNIIETHETYGCHLCDFDADRITVLDRHLLNYHNIGLENLLKLVMAKTKDSLNEDPIPILGIRQPYYKPQDEIIEDDEFIIETVAPRIKILKHAATNTEIQNDIPNFNDNCRMITKELDKLINYPLDKSEKDELSTKMRTLNEFMCKFVDSSNNLNRVITKSLNSKSSLRERGDEALYNLGLGDSSTPRDWEKAHSDRMERTKKKHDDTRNEKTKFSLDSFCF